VNKELIIHSTPTGVEIALLEDKKLVELHSEKSDARFAVGDLYLGKVKKLIPGLNAAFVDVGYEKDAFLHYTDLSPYARSLLKFTQLAINDKTPGGLDFASFQVEPEIVKTGKINEVLNGKPNILVQILKAAKSLCLAVSWYSHLSTISLRFRVKFILRKNASVCSASSNPSSRKILA
jgi:ribonuclease G